MTLFVKSFVPTCITRSSGFSFNYWSRFSTIVLLVPHWNVSNCNYVRLAESFFWYAIRPFFFNYLFWWLVCIFISQYLCCLLVFCIPVLLLPLLGSRWSSMLLSLKFQSSYFFPSKEIYNCNCFSKVDTVFLKFHNKLRISYFGMRMVSF